jgi:hemerythrin superfamily protein
MNAIDLLKQDHRKIEKLFSEFLSAEEAARQEELFQLIQTELQAHSAAEEQAFYPALRDGAPDKIDKALKDHAEVEQMLLQFLDADFDDENFHMQFSTLIENVERHVREEEGPGGVMQIAEKTLSPEQLDQMSRQIESIKRSVERDMAA